MTSAEIRELYNLIEQLKQALNNSEHQLSDARTQLATAVAWKERINPDDRYSISRHDDMLTRDAHGQWVMICTVDAAIAAQREQKDAPV